MATTLDPDMLATTTQLRGKFFIGSRRTGKTNSLIRAITDHIYKSRPSEIYIVYSSMAHKEHFRERLISNLRQYTGTRYDPCTFNPIPAITITTHNRGETRLYIENKYDNTTIRYISLSGAALIGRRIVPDSVIVFPDVDANKNSIMADFLASITPCLSIDGPPYVYADSIGRTDSSIHLPQCSQMVLAWTFGIANGRDVIEVIDDKGKDWGPQLLYQATSCKDITEEYTGTYLIKRVKLLKITNESYSEPSNIPMLRKEKLLTGLRNPFQ